MSQGSIVHCFFSSTAYYFSSLPLLFLLLAHSSVLCFCLPLLNPQRLLHHHLSLAGSPSIHLHDWTNANANASRITKKYPTQTKTSEAYTVKLQGGSFKQTACNLWPAIFSVQLNDYSGSQTNVRVTPIRQLHLENRAFEDAIERWKV